MEKADDRVGFKCVSPSLPETCTHACTDEAENGCWRYRTCQLLIKGLDGPPNISVRGENGGLMANENSTGAILYEMGSFPMIDIYCSHC